MAPQHPEHLPNNRLLLALPPAVLDELWPSLEPVPLKARRVIHYARLPIEHVYFVESGLVGATITLTIHAMQAAGAVEQGRAAIRILDRSKIESLSCNCYRVMRAAEAAVIEPLARANHRNVAIPHHHFRSEAIR